MDLENAREIVAEYKARLDAREICFHSFCI